MSSSSPSNGSKRKRTTIADRVKSTDPQRTSQDAMAEDPVDDSPAANTRHRKNNPSVDSNSATVPPNKRARTRSSAAKASSTSAHNSVDITVDDPDKPSSTTEDDIETEAAAEDQSRGQPTIDKDGEQELDDTERQMVQPPKAGQRDPIGGYKTNPPPVGRPVRIYADGVFDLFHLGHMRQLQQAKTAFPDTQLIVGVTGDVETHRRKGLTVLTGQERAETVRHCKWVDEVIPNCPWIVTKEFLAEHNIDYVAHDDEPYGADEGDDIYAPIKREGKFLVTERTDGVSTTGIITKIVRDYEKYIARQLKRGTSRQELNVSWLKKNEMDFKRHVTELRESIKQNWTTAGGEIGRDLRQFWQNAGVITGSRSNSPAPGARKLLSPQNGPRSPNVGTAVDYLKHLEVPGQSLRSDSPAARFSRSEDFAAGYSLGLLGGIKSWMSRTPRSLRDDQANSPDGSEEEDSRSPISEAGDAKSPDLKSPSSARGRKPNVASRAAESNV